MRRKFFWLCLFLFFLSANHVFIFSKPAFSCGFEQYREIKYTRELVQGMNALYDSFKETGLSKGSDDLLAITNAGYGHLNGEDSIGFLDIITSVTACTQGTKSLLVVHTPEYEPLWCALYRRDNGNLFFIKWTKKGFVRQKINITPEKIFKREAWKKAAKGIIGTKNLFSIVTVAHSWSKNVPWKLLKCAQFHNHICPGLNAGYIIAEYIKQKFPLSRGENYTFIASPPSCAADAIQVLFDSTTGKKGLYAKHLSRKMVQKYSGNLWFKNAPISPLIVIAMRLNKALNSCEGLLLGFDWKKLFEDTKTDYSQFAPPQGKKDPLYFISRASLSLKLASMKLQNKLKYVKVLKSFMVPASLSLKWAGSHADPYEDIFQLGKN